MDLDALRHGDFAKLGEAVTDWEQLTKKLAELKKSAEDDLRAKARKAKWAGANATVTREFVDKTAAEFADAHTQASSITKILSDTRSELVDYRARLNDALDRAARQHLTVVDTGAGTFTVTANTRPDWATDPTGGTSPVASSAVNALRDEIQDVLTKATESDQSAAKVLTLLVDQAKYGFTDARYADRDSAAEAVAAAERLARTAGDPSEMTLDEVEKFTRTLTKYHADPLFAEQFASRLGPKATLQFWTEMSHAHAGARGAELDTMRSLQKNLGLTLATASFSDSDAMRAWKRDLLASTNTSFHASTSHSPVGALGSQVLSSLMRQGRYDTEFLDDYRERLFKADKGAGESSTDALWVKGYDAVDLVFGEGNGRDPLEGLFEGLSHNPEAATHAFTSPSDLDHLLGTTVYTDRGESLGRALQAAVTGVANGDTTSVAPPHSAEQVDIMTNVMRAVAQPGSSANLVHQGLGEAFGNMAAAYMPEISNVLGGSGGDSVFLTNSEKHLAPEDATDVVRFLSAVSEDPLGRAGIVFGEGMYTSGLIEAHLADPTLFDGPDVKALETIGRNAGIVEGIVAQSLADNDVRAAVEGEASYNEALKAKGDFAKTWIAVGVTFVQIPEAYGGAAMGAVVGGGVGAVAGAAIDRVLQGQTMSGALDEALYQSSKDVFAARDSANTLTQWAAEESIARYDVDLPVDSAKNSIRVAVNEGWDNASALLRQSKERPNG
ncbi:hypothetical protein [Streptomyces flavalbus]|uniref:WXG100 family type VII secretion target n=1 Tax=Streptomyces flavalbus TaxID=2665155 RepID=A0ABW2WD72_9ACTN